MARFTQDGGPWSKLPNQGQLIQVSTKAAMRQLDALPVDVGVTASESLSTSRTTAAS
ncbi:hypothetical protein [Rhodopirellula sallentina]|uniref:Uncharacterized protein n=1 Tax=Rhodopirellula sallentina SM41 TaxID=1263870 RepID=M5UQJ4_9BACT|nr:hypothetical protein [Rhodopirellula sallentina]EMI58248.1 hypothetical protein RSSM_00318 [Rhodopirellula sallentina SM41]